MLKHVPDIPIFGDLVVYKKVLVVAKLRDAMPSKQVVYAMMV